MKKIKSKTSMCAWLLPALGMPPSIVCRADHIKNISLVATVYAQVSKCSKLVEICRDQWNELAVVLSCEDVPECACDRDQDHGEQLEEGENILTGPGAWGGKCVGHFGFCFELGTFYCD